MKSPVSLLTSTMLLALWIGSFPSTCLPEDFQKYVRTSEDFQRVNQSLAILRTDRWNHWILMPWRYRWGRGYDLDLARQMKEAGFNGAMCDHAPTEAGIHEQIGLPWYLDHAAGKGDLFLRSQNATRDALSSPRRPVCLADSSVRNRLMENLSASVRASLDFPSRIAYALDDEVSWSSFTNPCRWDNSPRSLEDFHRWLLERYGSREAVMNQWGTGGGRFWDRMATPDDFQDLYAKPWPAWNLSPWADALSYMDSQLCNLIGELVAQANRIDTQTPVGIVGGQCPAAYGGYDYAKLMRKIQFLETYDLGCSAEIARSLRPQSAVPLVKTGFGDPLSPENVWRRWHYLIHGDRGHIAWAEGWFRQDEIPEERVLLLGAEVQKLARAWPTLHQAQWEHDGIAIYYSHPAIQISWFVDCQPHGKTWMGRSSSMNDVLASTAGTFWAWTKLLEDAGLQYNFYSYADLLEEGIDAQQYPVLILPRVMALSHAEADEMAQYVRAGGHIIADHCPGWFDQHLRGRQRPVLDNLFGIEQHPPAGPGKLFGGGLLAEIDAERYWNSNFVEAAAMMWSACRRENGYVVAERDLPCFREQTTGRGWAHLMNVSVIEYVFLRVFDPPEATRYRRLIVDLLARAGVKPRVTVLVNGEPPQRTEITRWRGEERSAVCVARNPLVLGVPPEIWQESIVSGEVVTLKVVFDLPVQDAVDERSEKSLGDGIEFEVPWNTSEAVVISFKRR